MLRKEKRAVAALAFVAVALSACQNSGSATGGATASPAQSTPVQPAASPAAQDPLGKYDQPVTIHIGTAVDPTDKSLPPGDTPGNNYYTRYVKDQLNIDTQISWQAAVGSNYNQKVNLSIASNDLPDAMIVNGTQLAQMVKAGELADLTAAYQQYASPVMKRIVDSTHGAVNQFVTFNGKMMALPNVAASAEGVHMLWIRQDWLDKLHLQPPKTMDDLEKVAKAFVEQDPDGDGKKDTIGIVGPQSGGKLNATFLASTGNMFGFDPVFSAYHAYPGYWVKDAGGHAVYGSIQPETKQALAELRQLYAAGLIDPEMGVRKDSLEPVNAGKAGIFFAHWGAPFSLSDAVTNDPKANWKAYLLPLDEKGQFNAHMGAISNIFLVVRKGYEHPEDVVKMNNLLLRDSGKMSASTPTNNINYPLRQSMAASDGPEYTVKAIREVLSGAKTPDDYNDKPEYKLLQSDFVNAKKVKLQPYDNTDIQYWNVKADVNSWRREYSIMVGAAPLLDPYNKVYSLVYSQTPSMGSKWANLDKLEQGAFLKIIMGAAPLDSFDQFVKDWKSQGGDQITAEVAEAAKQ